MCTIFSCIINMILITISIIYFCILLFIMAMVTDMAEITHGHAADCFKSIYWKERNQGESEIQSSGKKTGK